MYIHIPFCQGKCGYCDFFSVSPGSPRQIDDYINGLAAEIQQRALSYTEKNIATIYFGGGTPSLITGTGIEKILKAVFKYYSVKPGVEITLEANPATLSREQVCQYCGAGINRFSIGVQSFNPAELKVLVRKHQPKHVYQTVDILQAQNISNYNLDLIYGIPGQTIHGFAANLQKALDLKPVHISIYLLQLDPVTPLAQSIQRKEVAMLSEDTEWEMYTRGQQVLNSSGLNHYEISNFSQANYECQHNLIYWQGREYIGLGAGAVSFQGHMRYRNKPSINGYLNSLKTGDRATEVLEVMDDAGLVSDAIILGLRLCQGINLNEFLRRYGVDILATYPQAVEHSIKQGLLELENGWLRLTKEAYFISNEVLYRFMA